MKKRILVLGLFAILLAVGSAFAPFVANEDAYIRVKQTADSTDFVLQDSGKDCDTSGSSPCEIEVSTELQGIVKVAGRNSSNQTITHTSAPAQMSSLSVYDAE